MILLFCQLALLLLNYQVRLSDVFRTILTVKYIFKHYELPG